MFLSSWSSSKSRRSSCSARRTAWWTSISVSNWRWTKIIITSHESFIRVTPYESYYMTPIIWWQDQPENVTWPWSQPIQTKPWPKTKKSIPSVTMSIQIRINSISWPGRISIPPWIRCPTCPKWSEISPCSISWCLTARGIWWWCAIGIARGISRGIWWRWWFCSCWRDEIWIVSLLSPLRRFSKLNLNESDWLTYQINLKTNLIIITIGWNQCFKNDKSNNANKYQQPKIWAFFI